jgi:dATP pyrophosphohydrolase
MVHRYDLVQCYVVRPAGDSHEFLQLHRQRDDYMGGTWQPVAGCVERDETAWQAAVRELYEETSLAPLELYSVQMVQTFYTAADDTLWHSVPFCAIVPADAPIRLNAEHDAFRWLGRHDAAAQFLWSGDRRAVEEICRTILDNAPARSFLRLPT